MSECCFEMNVNSGASLAIIGGGGVIGVDIKKLSDGTSGKFRIAGGGFGLIIDLGLRFGKKTFCCHEDPCPKISDFAGASVTVVTWSLAFIVGFGKTTITISGVPGCGTIKFETWHGEAGAAGLGGIRYSGTLTPV